jgi:hypothetical protein
MRRILITVFVLLVSSSMFAASKRFILTPQRILNEQEQADLASRGLIIDRPLSNGRFLVRVADDASIADDDPRIRALTPLTASAKLHRTVLREVASGRPVARLDVLFQDDVSFESAKAAIEAAGGSLIEPLQHDFHEPRRISARIASSSVSILAGDERVLLVYGPMNLRKESENAAAAAESNVTPLFAAPYSLSGQGVALSYFEFGQADTSHPEFGGRLMTHLTATSDRDHATHVAGTMIAAGIDARAKGMAPAATLHEFDGNDDNFLDLKQKLPNFSAVADNNSWGYVLGWCSSGSDCSGKWVWEDNDLYYGGYDSLVTAPLDKITRTTGVLMVHSAGNDANKLGPVSAPFAHSHFNDAGRVIDGYCYSTDGSGNDCPAPTCTAGASFCETTRHPQITSLLPAPWISIGLTAAAKNVIAVGAVDSSKQIVGFSSRGPTRDGRVKPDLVAKGINVYSTIPGSSYATMNGTSMSSPVVTGTAALLIEQWRRTFGGANPTPAALKTLMLATADDLGNTGPDYTYGFGLLNAKAAADTILADAAQGRRIKIDSIATGGKMEIPVSLSSPQDLRVVLGWSDPEVLTFPDPTYEDDPLATATLVNDLDVKVVDPTGADVLPYVLSRDNPLQPATRGINKVDNTEEVEIAGAVAGTYKIVVTGTSVTASSPQTYVLVTNGDLGVAALPCTDVFEPNNSPDTAYGNLVSTQTIDGRTCEQSDVDYFKFLVDRPGTVSVRVTASDTPIRVTLSSNVTAPVTVDVAAGATQTVSTTYSGTTAMTFFARVEPAGTIGSAARYTITPTFPFAAHARRRSAARH